MFWLGLWALGAGLNVVMGWHGWAQVWGGSLADGDSYLRVQRLLQGVHQGHLINGVTGGAGGTKVVEWSHLLDLLLWLIAAPLSLLIGWPRAVFDAGVALGPLGVGLLGVAMALVAEPLVARRFLILPAAAAATLPGLVGYAAPGLVSDHIFALALIALSAALLVRAWQGDSGVAFLGGMAGGFAVWLSPQAVPFVLLCFAAFQLHWLESRIGAAVATAGAGFFDVVGFGLAIDPPAGGYGMADMQRLSVVYAGLGLAVLLGGIGMWQADLRLRESVRRRAVGLASVFVTMLIWLAIFPRVLGAVLPPPAVPGDEFAALFPGVVGVCLALLGWLAYRNWRWAFLCIVLGGLLVFGIQGFGLAGMSAVAAAILVTVAMQRLSARWAARNLVATAARVGLVALLLVVPRLPGIAWQFLQIRH